MITILSVIIAVVLFIVGGLLALSLFLLVIGRIAFEILEHVGRKIDKGAERRKQKRKEEYNKKHNIKTYTITFDDVRRFIASIIRGR